MTTKLTAMTTVTAALAVVALSTAGLSLSPPAQATCAALLGFSTDPTRCTSSPLGIAIALGPNAGARAAGLLGFAFAAGPDSFADTPGGAVNVALQLGANGTTVADGFLNLAANLSLRTSVPGGSEVRAQGGFGNVAINLFGDGTVAFEGHQVVADGILNVAANLGGTDNAVLAGRNGEGGTLNAAVSMFSRGSNVVAGDGFFNAAAQMGGTGNRAFATNGTANFAAQLGGSGNEVYARNGTANAAAQLEGTGNQVFATNGAANAAAQLGGSDNYVYAGNGAANAAAQLGGIGNSVYAGNGTVNAASQGGGDYTTVRAGGDGNADGYFTAAFSLLSNGQDALERNTVLASPGPLALAGSIGQNSANVVQSGPGININRSSPAARRAAVRTRSASTADVSQTRNGRPRPAG